MIRFPDEFFPKTEFPAQMVAEYWFTVAKTLESKGISYEDAIKAIKDYQDRLNSHDCFKNSTIDIVYHDEPEYTAGGILNYLKSVEFRKKIDEMSIQELKDEIIKLRQAIILHRDERGHDRCWLDDCRLYQVLGDVNPNEMILPPKEEFLQNCEQYWCNRQPKT